MIQGAQRCSKYTVHTISVQSEIQEPGTWIYFHRHWHSQSPAAGCVQRIKIVLKYTWLHSEKNLETGGGSFSCSPCINNIQDMLSYTVTTLQKTFGLDFLWGGNGTLLENCQIYPPTLAISFPCCSLISHVKLRNWINYTPHRALRLPFLHLLLGTWLLCDLHFAIAFQFHPPPQRET